MYVVIDHFDSFTYNLVQMLRATVADEVRCIRSDAFSLAELEALPLKGLIFSPGPGSPEEYPGSLEAVRHFAGRVPILGVCLGHAQLAAAFGGRIRRGKRIMHGKVDETLSDGRGCFRNISSPASFMRYHSLVLDPASLPECFEVSARSRLDGDIMAIRHKEYQIEGVQFHPESIGSQAGRKVLDNFVNYRREPFPTRQALSGLLAGESMDQRTARAFMLEAAEGNLTDVQIAGFLCGFEAKGVTAKEIAGCVSVLVDKCIPFPTQHAVLDIVGIGGDGKGSFNLSSMAAIVAAACGQPVAKHGNRAVSSFCGSADFFAELGYPLTLSPEKTTQLLARTGFAFLFAPIYHSAMRHSVTARRELAIRTIMNLLGPLSSPAQAAFQIIGVPDPVLLYPIAEAAMLLGRERVITLHSEDGLDEFSCAAPTHCVLAEVGKGCRKFIFDPADAGVTGCSSDSLVGGTAEDNVAIAMQLLAGEGKSDLIDAICLNSGAGLYVSGRAPSIIAGYNVSKEAFIAGRVKAKLKEIIQVAHGLMQP